MSKVISTQTFKMKQEIEDRIRKLSGRQARIALLRIMSDVRMSARMQGALSVAESYPKDEEGSDKS